ncbi:MAG: RluA family pseudouridine synthase [Planctomycetaceae bacterium]|nr:RluA family pseudouridine synthase [Planctomycetaceae bacterium]
MNRLDVICEDGPVIAVNKPSGLICQGAPIGVDSLVSQVKEYLKVKYDKPGNVYLGVPHRLDRPVSGVVVFSRNSKCAARLSEQFAKRQVEKTYVALLEHVPDEPEGELVDWLYRVPDQPRVLVVNCNRADAKEARLHYRTLRTVRGKALVAVRLGTGRMHQIRVQFASRQCPIVGDTQYGARGPFPGFPNDPLTAPIGLHGAELTILHPIRYDRLTIQAPLPDTWKRLGMPKLDPRELAALDWPQSATAATVEESGD